MAQVRQHLNARLTPRPAPAMVDVLVVEDWSVAATAERFQSTQDGAQVARPLPRRGRRRLGGSFQPAAPFPGAHPRSDPAADHRAAHQRRPWIAHVVGLALSTLQKILNETGLGRLDRGDRGSAQRPCAMCANALVN